jgi:uroporphyrinogen decarboxylase
MTEIQAPPFLEALAGRTPARVPVWFMRQAGRFLPEYRAVRARHTFEEMLHSPDLITEVTLQPVERLGVDAAILFSDILVLPEALGMGLSYVDGEGPRFDAPLEGVGSLRPFEPASIAFLTRGVRQIVAASKVPLIGFAGTPWTVALYMLEGRHGRDFLRARRFLREKPAEFRAVLEAVTEATGAYLEAQVEAGARAVQLFDSWGGLLGPEEQRSLAHPCVERLAARLHARFPGLPVILYSKGTGAYLLDLIEKTNIDALNPDWTVDLAACRRDPRCPPAVQGNLDPSLFFADEATIRSAVHDLIRAVGRRGYVLNAGHGLNPELDPGRVKLAVDAAHEAGAA